MNRHQSKSFNLLNTFELLQLIHDLTDIVFTTIWNDLLNT